MLTDQVVLTFPYHSAKIQRLPPSEYEILGPAVEVFDFDWSIAPFGHLEAGRTSKTLPLRFTRGGVFNALLILFTLQMDAADGMAEADAAAPDGEPCDREGIDSDYTSGPENLETHWDQPARYLPIELQVREGDTLQVTATHNLHDVEKIHLHGVSETMLSGSIGHFEFLDTHANPSPLGMKLGVGLSTRSRPPAQS